MPIYEYIAEAEKGCRICRGGFELRRPADRPPLEVCPLCKAPVRKQVSRANPLRTVRATTTAEAQAAGFTVLERRDKGVYEKL